MSRRNAASRQGDFLAHTAAPVPSPQRSQQSGSRAAAIRLPVPLPDVSQNFVASARNSRTSDFETLELSLPGERMPQRWEHFRRRRNCLPADGERANCTNHSQMVRAFLWRIWQQSGNARAHAGNVTDCLTVAARHSRYAICIAYSYHGNPYALRLKKTVVPL